MDKNLLVFWLLLLSPMFALAESEPPSQAPAKVITLAADEWCPYNCAHDSEKAGYMIDIARAIFEPLGYTINYQIVPWTRAVRHTLSGRYDGAIGATKDEIPSAIFPHQSLGYSSNFFVTRYDSSWVYEGITSLSAVRLAAIQDYDYGKDINRYLSSSSNAYSILMMTGNHIPKKCLQLLTRGRIDACIEDKNVILYEAQQENLFHHLRLAGETETHQALYIAFSPKLPLANRYAGILSEGLDSLRRSGELSLILKSYGLSDWAMNPLQAPH